MAEKRSSGEILANVIREHYDLGEVQLPRRLEEVHQRRHRKLVVETSKGRFLVKTYRREPRVLDALAFQHRLSDHLLEHDLPVAHIKEARDGKRIVEIDNWALELQQFIEGVPMQMTAKSLARSAIALGRFHQVCRDFPHPDRETVKWRFSEVPRDTFASLYERAKLEGDPVKIDAACDNIALFLRDAGQELSADACSQFETGLIHGDWHSGNLIFQAEKLAGIVDLEFAGDGCYLEDIAYAVSNLCVRTATEPKRLDYRTNLLLDYYERWRTLSPAENRALYYAVGVKHVATVSYQSVQQDGKVAGHTGSEWMQRLSLQCRWLTERARAARHGAA